MEKHSHSRTPQILQRSSLLTCKVGAPYTALNIFPQSSNDVNQTLSILPKTTERRRGLANSPLVFTVPSKAAECLSNSKGGIFEMSAVTLLNALRRRTLLDLPCMREFSLLRTKPLTKRNLSRLSTSSVYNIHVEQSYLQQLANLSTTQKDTDTRVASPVKQKKPQIAHAHRKIKSYSGIQPPTTCNTFTASPPLRFTYPPQKPAGRSLQQFRTKPKFPETRQLTVTEQHGFLLEQDLEALMLATSYSRAELFARWAHFKALCSMTTSSYGVTKELLRHRNSQLVADDKSFVDCAFDVLDVHGSGALDWPDFIAVLSVVEKGNFFRRLVFLFQAYKLNGNSSICRHEVELFYLASSHSPSTPQSLEVVRHFVDNLFSSLSREQSDSIQVEDALAFLYQHSDLDELNGLECT